MYKLILYIRGGQKEKLTDITEKHGNEDGENDLNFKEEEVVENVDTDENEVI